MRRPVALAVELARLGARFVVVGGTARALMSDAAADPLDLDVRVEPADAAGLATAVRLLGARLDVERLLRCRDVHVDTAWGPLDVFVTAPAPRACAVVADGTALRVAP